jgi:hypothetical protein
MPTILASLAGDGTLGTSIQRGKRSAPGRRAACMLAVRDPGGPGSQLTGKRQQWRETVGRPMAAWPAAKLRQRSGAAGRRADRDRNRRRRGGRKATRGAGNRPGGIRLRAWALLGCRVGARATRRTLAGAASGADGARETDRWQDRGNTWSRGPSLAAAARGSSQAGSPPALRHAAAACREWARAARGARPASARYAGPASVRGRGTGGRRGPCVRTPRSSGRCWQRARRSHRSR